MTDPRIRVVKLTYVHYQHPDLNESLRFFSDFGFVEEKRVDGRVYLRGYGIDPFVYVAEQSPDDKRHFIGGYWTVESAEELQKAAQHPKASKIQDSSAPGGGKVVTIEDLNGYTVGFIFGQELRSTDSKSSTLEKEESGHDWNFHENKPRQGEFRRFQKGACPVHKLGHYGFIVPPSRFKSTLGWYLDLMNLKPTDSTYNPKTDDDEVTFNHIDLGKRYTDHHSFFVATGAESDPVHVHHSSFEVNDFDSEVIGHDWLTKHGWTNVWGVGRHLLGSQIFDYWFDASGNVVEHYSDGDLVNEDSSYSRLPSGPDSLYVWGPDIPLSFVNPNMKEGVAVPPNVLEAIPARV